MNGEGAYLRRLPEDFPGLKFETVREDDHWLVLEIVHPGGGENPWISNDDDFVWGVGGAHCHHFHCETLEEAYRETCREITDYIEGRTMVWEAYRGEDWFQSGFQDVEDWMESCTPKTLLERLLGEEPKAGFRMETFFWQAARDQVILVQPDGAVVVRRRFPFD